MLKTLQWMLFCAIALPVLLVCLALALAVYSVEEQPLVHRAAPVDYETVAAGKALVKRIKMQMETAGANDTTLVVSEDELNHLAQLGSHTFERLSTDVRVDGTVINSRLSMRLPENIFGKYLNVSVQMRPSSQGIEVDRLTVGPLQMPGRWLLPLVARLVDTLLREDQASLLLAGAHEFRIKGDSALLDVVPPPDLKAQLKQAVRILQASRLPPGDQERILHYYNLLVGIGAANSRRTESLNHYLTPLMAEAAKRGSAVAENRAAIWALNIYFSNGALEALIGKVVSAQRALVRSPPGVTLGGREDLLLHFLYSGGIALATQQGIGIAAGEFKELLDSGYGGSGFSFADLAADRAGLEFVTAATASEDEARRIQERIIAGNREADFFPDISGLTEGLSDAQFEQQYGDVQSERYRRQVELIDRLIARLPIYTKAINAEQI